MGHSGGHRFGNGGKGRGEGEEERPNGRTGTKERSTKEKGQEWTGQLHPFIRPKKLFILLPSLYPTSSFASSLNSNDPHPVDRFGPSILSILMPAHSFFVPSTPSSANPFIKLIPNPQSSHASVENRLHAFALLSVRPFHSRIPTNPPPPPLKPLLRPFKSPPIASLSIHSFSFLLFFLPHLLLFSSFLAPPLNYLPTLSPLPPPGMATTIGFPPSPSLSPSRPFQFSALFSP